nr:hypothetical protein [Tanacetum cinerariifolium]
MCMSDTDVAQVANAARNYEILHERDDDDTERPDKRKKSGDRLQPTSQQSSHRNHGHTNDRHGSDRRGGSDNHRSSNNNYSGSNNRSSGNGRDQRNRGQQSNRYANSGRGRQGGDQGAFKVFGFLLGNVIEVLEDSIAVLDGKKDHEIRTYGMATDYGIMKEENVQTKWTEIRTWNE